MGVEEEFLLVDPETGTASASSGAVLLAAETVHDDSDLTGELQREQIETGTRPQRTPSALAAELRRTRQQAHAAATAAGTALVPLATSPLPANPTVSPAPRYRRMIDQFGLTGVE